MSDRLTGVRIKIERAKEHIRNLETEVSTFIESSDNRVVAEDDSETGDLVYVARIGAPIPLRFGAIVGDTVHNLRASLDVLIAELVLASGGTFTPKVKFPFAKDADSFKSLDLRPIQCLGKAGMDLLQATEPYGGGNQALWALHDLDIIDKHRVLLPIWATVVSVGTRQFGFERKPTLNWDLSVHSMSVHGVTHYFHDAVDDGTILLRVEAARRTSEVDVEAQATFTIAFGENWLLKGKAVIPTLLQLAEKVEGVVEAFAVLLPGAHGAPREST
jgi:hypothetical protein